MRYGVAVNQTIWLIFGSHTHSAMPLLSRAQPHAHELVEANWFASALTAGCEKETHHSFASCVAAFPVFLLIFRFNRRSKRTASVVPCSARRCTPHSIPFRFIAGNRRVLVFNAAARSKPKVFTCATDVDCRHQQHTSTTAAAACLAYHLAAITRTRVGEGVGLLPCCTFTRK